MAMKMDFNDPLISVLDQWRLLMAMKIFFMTHERIFMKNLWFQLGYENRKLQYS